MSINDPIGDMLTRIRNAMLVGHATVSLPTSKIKLAIAAILQEEGFLDGFEETPAEDTPSAVLRLKLRYVGERRARRPVIHGLQRISRPGRRVYTARRKIPWVRSGLGVAILSTPKGVMTGARARQLGVGGEVLCQVW
jgi:small subunit ribosomal protein S8